jgi:hypothetical protein
MDVGQSRHRPARNLAAQHVSPHPERSLAEILLNGGEFDSFSGTDNRTGRLAKQSREKLVVYESSASSAIWSTGCNHKR